MNKRSLYYWGIGAVCALAVALLWGIFGTHSVSFNEDEIRSRIRQHLNEDIAVSGLAKVAVKSLHLTGIDLRLGNGTIAAAFDVKGRLRFGKEFSMRVRAAGIPRYEAGAFYLRPEKIEVLSFAFSGEKPAEALSAAADRYVSDPKKATLAKDIAAKLEGWVTDAAENAATYALSKRPVYQLKDEGKGWVIQSALKTLKVEPGKATVTFSLTQLTVSVVTGFFFLVLGIVGFVALILHPTWGAPGRAVLVVVSAFG